MSKPGDAIAKWARLNEQFAGLGTLPNGKPNLPTPNSLLAPAMAQYALNPQYAFDHEQTIWEMHGCPGQFKDYFVRIYSGADPVAKDITFGAMMLKIRLCIQAAPLRQGITDGLSLIKQKMFTATITICRIFSVQLHRRMIKEIS